MKLDVQLTGEEADGLGAAGDRMDVEALDDDPGGIGDRGEAGLPMANTPSMGLAWSASSRSPTMATEPAPSKAT
jgi:hypothetical protein